MSGDLYDGRRVDGLIPLEIFEALTDPVKAADFLSLFGADGIVLSDWDEFDGPIRPPLLRIVPIETANARVLGYQLDINYEVQLALYLPRSTPARDSIAAPAAPVASAVAGSLTGSYFWALTRVTADGESYVAMTTTTRPVPTFSNVLTLAGQAGSLAWSAAAPGTECFRLWRVAAGRLLPQLVAVLPPDVTSYVDDVPDAELGDEIAPIKGLAQAIKGLVLKVAANAEPLVKGSQTTDPVTSFAQTSDGVVSPRNLRLIKLATRWPLIADVRTRESTVVAP